MHIYIGEPITLPVPEYVSATDEEIPGPPSTVTISGDTVTNYAAILRMFENRRVLTMTRRLGVEPESYVNAMKDRLADRLIDEARYAGVMVFGNVTVVEEGEGAQRTLRATAIGLMPFEWKTARR